MSHEFINPNWHIILIHYPLGLLVAGLLIEIFSFLWRRSGFRTAGRWMILLGALSMIPAATVGIYALCDIALVDSPPSNVIWNDAATQNPLLEKTPRGWEFLDRHAWLQSAATVLSVLAVVFWLGASNRRRESMHIPLLIMLIVGVALMTMGAWYSGEAVYRYGAGVDRVQTDPPEPDTADTTSDNLPDKVFYYLPPLQTHTLLAGVAVAIAMGALGLSLRLLSYDVPGSNRLEYTPDPELTTRGVDDSLIRSINPATRLEERVPASRFWLLAAFVALMTSATGAWFLASEMETWDPNRLWDIIRNSQRRMYHVLAGGSIIVLPLLLAAFAKWAPRKRLLLYLVSLLFLGAVALQVWLGVLLMFDTPAGSVTGFNDTAAAQVQIAPADDAAEPATRETTPPIPDITITVPTTLPTTQPATVPTS